VQLTLDFDGDNLHIFFLVDTATNRLSIVGGISAAVSKTAAAPIERVKLLIQNQVRFHLRALQLHATASLTTIFFTG
jgi:hypothetical protein